ncbi:MAG: hypothetical protein RIA62_10515 [Cyclobacteriaceae bacterium]
MGYMGFGMRKEVYKRKPKESFKKLKELYGNDIPKAKFDPDAPVLTSEDVLNKPRFRSIHDTKLFQIAKVAIMFLLIGVFINALFIQPWLHKIEMEAFQENLVSSYSEDHQFLLNSGEKLNLQYFRFDSLNESFVTASNGFRFSGSGWHINRPEVARIGIWNDDATDIELSNDQLKVFRKDSTQILTNWVVIFKSDKKDAQYTKVLQQLSIDLEYVEKLRSKLRSLKISEIAYEDSLTTLEVANTNDFGAYEFQRTHKKIKKSKNLLKIDELTYLRKKY